MGKDFVFIHYLQVDEISSHNLIPIRTNTYKKFFYCTQTLCKKPKIDTVNPKASIVDGMMRMLMFVNISKYVYGE